MYADDLLVFSIDENTHYDHLKEIFRRIREFGLSINFEKSNFGVPEVIYLG